MMPAHQASAADRCTPTGCLNSRPRMVSMTGVAGWWPGETAQPPRHGPDRDEGAARVAEEHQEKHRRVRCLRSGNGQAEGGRQPGDRRHEQQEHPDRGGQHGRTRHVEGPEAVDDAAGHVRADGDRRGGRAGHGAQQHAGDHVVDVAGADVHRPAEQVDEHHHQHDGQHQRGQQGVRAPGGEAQAARGHGQGVRHERPPSRVRSG